MQLIAVGYFQIFILDGFAQSNGDALSHLRTQGQLVQLLTQRFQMAHKIRLLDDQAGNCSLLPLFPLHKVLVGTADRRTLPQRQLGLERCQPAVDFVNLRCQVFAHGGEMPLALQSLGKGGPTGDDVPRHVDLQIFSTARQHKA